MKRSSRPRATFPAHRFPWSTSIRRIAKRALSVRDALRGKHILLVGATGFIGKVWLANLLTDLPEIGRIYLLIRRNRVDHGAAALSARR